MIADDLPPDELDWIGFDAAELHALTDPPDPPDPADLEHERQRRADLAVLAAETRRKLGEATTQSDDIRPVPSLAVEDDILRLVADELEHAGVAGERRLVKLVYLIVTSRLFARPVSVAVKGPSAGGKSYTVERVLRLFPPDAYHEITGMSDHALVYAFDDVSLVHKMLVVYEAVGMASEVASYLMRSLLSEGHLKYVTVVKGKNGMTGRTIDRPGPTGLVTTTTAVNLHPENETRMLSLTVTDSPDQTRAVMLAHADDATGEIDVAPWHDLQEWIAERPAAVVVPYARTLAEAIPPVAVRLRRDFPTIVTLVKAHALLHQMRRERDASGRILADFTDYEAVRGLVADLVADAVEKTVPAIVRDTVRAIGDLTLAGGDCTTVAVATAIGIDKSAAWRRCQQAIARGFVKNLEDRNRRPARLTLGEPLPDDVPVLPAADELERLHDCTTVSGGSEDPPETEVNEHPERGPHMTPPIDSSIVQSSFDALAAARNLWGDELVEPAS
jgi:hypothetical protein